MGRRRAPKGMGWSAASNPFWAASLGGNTTLPVGHVQVPKLQTDAAGQTPLFDAKRVKYFLDTVVQILRDAQPGI